MGWQELLIAAMLVAAAAYLGRRVWRSVAGRSTAGCGTGCQSCPSRQASDAEPAGFVPLEQVVRGPGG